VAKWFEIAQRSQWRAIGNHHRSFQWYDRWPPTTSHSLKIGVPNAPLMISQISNGHISAMVGFSGLADRMTLFLVRSNSRWRPSAIMNNLKIRMFRKFRLSETKQHMTHHYHWICISSAEMDDTSPDVEHLQQTVNMSSYLSTYKQHHRRFLNHHRDTQLFFLFHPHNFKFIVTSRCYWSMQSWLHHAWQICWKTL